MMVARKHFELESALSSGVVSRAGERVRRFLCGLHGHDALLHFDGGRMSLVCTSCSYESPGWDLRHSSPRVSANAVPAQATALTLVNEHRAA